MLYVHSGHNGNRRLTRDGTPGRPSRLPHSSWVPTAACDHVPVHMGWTLPLLVGPDPLWSSGKALGHRFDYHFGSPLSLNFVLYGHGLVIFPLTIKATLKRLTSLPVHRTNTESFWWWQCSVRYSLPLPPPPGISVPASTSSGDTVALAIVSFLPHILGSRSPPVPLVVTL